MTADWCYSLRHTLRVLVNPAAIGPGARRCAARTPWQCRDQAMCLLGWHRLPCRASSFWAAARMDGPPGWAGDHPSGRGQAQCCPGCDASQLEGLSQRAGAVDNHVGGCGVRVHAEVAQPLQLKPARHSGSGPTRHVTAQPSSRQRSQQQCHAAPPMRPCPWDVQAAPKCPGIQATLSGRSTGMGTHLSPALAAARGGEARQPLSTTSDLGFRSSSQAASRAAGSSDLNSVSYRRASKLGGAWPGRGCATQLSTPCAGRQPGEGVRRERHPARSRRAWGASAGTALASARKPCPARAAKLARCTLLLVEQHIRCWNRAQGWPANQLGACTLRDCAAVCSRGRGSQRA